MPQQLIDREAVMRLFDEAIDRGLISKTAAALFRQLIAALPVETAQATSMERERISQLLVDELVPWLDNHGNDAWADDCREAARLLRAPQHQEQSGNLPAPPTDPA